MENYEIERKFLIRRPDPAFISENTLSTDIVQTYLVPQKQGETERVRKRSGGGCCVYTHTVKKKLTEITRLETEKEISKSEYAELLSRADTARRPVEKKRCCYEYRGQMFEIDIYPFWTGQAIMELELEREEQEIIFPPDIEVIREVTGDRRYTNKALALSVPDEEVQNMKG